MYSYGLGLLVLLGLLGLVDRYYGLVLARDAKRALRLMVAALLIFIIWDMLGIHLQIYVAGTSRFMTGLFLPGHFPIEELLFLATLVYLPLVLWELVQRGRHD